MKTTLEEKEENFKVEYPEIYDLIDIKMTGMVMGIENYSNDREFASAAFAEQKLEDFENCFKILLEAIYKS